MNVIFNWICQHPWFFTYLYFQIGIIAAIIASVVAHIEGENTDDSDFMGLYTTCIIFWPILSLIAILCIIFESISLIGEAVANVIERDQ
jgi:hypothetical protein